MLPSGQDWNNANSLDVLRVLGSYGPEAYGLLGSELLQGHGPGELGRPLKFEDLLQPMTFKS